MSIVQCRFETMTAAVDTENRRIHTAAITQRLHRQRTVNHRHGGTVLFFRNKANNFNDGESGVLNAER
jgi:hypothetical protein